MADRTSARVFGKFFTHLAKNPDKRNKELAKEIFDDSGELDFSEYQMCCDDALVKLGLAKYGISKEYPEDGEIIHYYPFGDLQP